MNRRIACGAFLLALMALAFAVADTSTPGNLAVYILRRHDGERTHFVTLTFWESLQAIEGFAGDPVDRAKYYPEDQDFLLEFEPNVQHWEVIGSAKP